MRIHLVYYIFAVLLVGKRNALRCNNLQRYSKYLISKQMKAIFYKEVTTERRYKQGCTERENTKSRTTIVRLFGIKIYCKKELFVDE